MGSVEILCSMKTLDFDHRTRVARESIRLVCSSIGIQLKERRKSEPFILSVIAAKPNIIHSRTPVLLTIDMEALILKRIVDSQILCSHKMEGISFASAGEHETKDYIAYVAKDNTNKRACHVLLCDENQSLDVITTIGQAFELRYRDYMQSQTGNGGSSRSLERNLGENLHDRPIQAEMLLYHNGDFLVRESAKIPRQFILSGRYKDTFKHLLLVDPQGVIRTKDLEFDSINHLVSYHKEGNIPIVSADSELLLLNPIHRK
ncbi:unnamed protein product [Didymodactylos carnosus]|uniref:SHC-transforming protein 1 n=1 Tax=Didymodactylos carnosus TaxID=1234261 RepID=A0A814K7F8_9BILA|nr:unnamed protein product [Didymodactylos carnosus]CAF1317484.1 unnamed protein product [Didymodactylos carnosus]CAF3815491.1 unnamed protein product [Didymodactylos carnosus]CAF4126564.1 unnamed protein product [Didymodactylos carnosus]